MSIGSFFGRKSNKSKGVILIDIASSSVGAGIAVMTEGGKPRIVFEAREQFPIQARLNNRRLLPLVNEALNKIIASLSHKGISKLIDEDGRKIKIDKIVCMFSSPWHVSTTKTLHFKFEKPFTISPNFISDIISYESKNFLASVNKENHGIGFEGDNKADYSQEEVLQTFINGYSVKYPIDKRANEFEMVLFMSVFPHQVVKSLEKVCGKYFPDTHLEFSSGTGVYFHVLRELFPAEDSFIIAHISGETTDISVIKKNIITETISFPLGRNFIVRRLLSEVSGITPAVALSMIRVNDEGGVTPKLSEKLGKILIEAENDWVKLFAESLSDFSKNFFLPIKVYVLSGDDSSKTFSDIINQKKLKVRGDDTPTLVSQNIDTSLFSSVVEVGSAGSKDLFVATGAYYSKSKYFSNF